MSQMTDFKKSGHISVCLWFLQVGILWTFISLVIWKSLTPKSPAYAITGVHIPALHKPNSTFYFSELGTRQNTSVYESKQNPSRIAAKRNIVNESIILSLEISNPNERIGICYDDFNITLDYNHTTLGTTKSCSGFYQGYKKTTLCQVRVKIHQPLMRVISSSSIGVRVCLRTAFRYVIFIYKTKHHRTEFEAYIGIDSNGRKSAEKKVQLQVSDHA